MQYEPIPLGFFSIEIDLQSYILQSLHSQCFFGLHNSLCNIDEINLLCLHSSHLYLLRRSLGYLPSYYFSDFRYTIRSSNLWYSFLCIPSVKLHPIFADKLRWFWLYDNLQDKWNYEYLCSLDGKEGRAELRMVSENPLAQREEKTNGQMMILFLY